VGSRAGVDVCGKSLPRPGFDPWNVQPLENHYTDYAVPSHSILEIRNVNKESSGFAKGRYVKFRICIT
jgi:hypothetical protein